jgi:hypothetical protein
MLLNTMTKLTAIAAASLTLAGCSGLRPMPVAPMPVAQVSQVQSAAAKIETAATRKPKDNQWVTIQGKVTQLLPQDNDGSRHQHFLFQPTNPKAKLVKVAHNIDLAPIVPVKVGDLVKVKCEFIKDNPYDVAHWTHFDPRGGQGGYIELNGRIYDRL